MDELFDLKGLSYVLEDECGNALIGGGDAYCSDAEDALPKIDLDTEVADTVEKNLVLMDVQPAAADEQTVVAQGVSCESNGHAQNSFSVMPDFNYL